MPYINVEKLFCPKSFGSGRQNLPLKKICPKTYVRKTMTIVLDIVFHLHDINHINPSNITHKNRANEHIINRNVDKTFEDIKSISKLRIILKKSKHKIRSRYATFLLIFLSA